MIEMGEKAEVVTAARDARRVANFIVARIGRPTALAWAGNDTLSRSGMPWQLALALAVVCASPVSFVT
eukprot:scaffold7002_cov106-Skeletonema_marinoi.AAC.1